MANLKISQLPPQNDILQINGLAGYDGTGTIRISGTDLRNSLLQPASGNLQIRPQAGTIVLGLTGQGIDINGNTQINGSLNLNIDSNTYGVIGTSSFTSISFNGTAAATSSGYAVRLSGPVADSNNAVGTSGQVLSSTGSGTQWINAGGSTPNLQAVMTQGSSYQGPNVVKLQTDHASGNQMIEFASNAMYVRDTQNSQGLVYWTDYSANFTTNSLVSKLYVDTRPTPNLASVLLQNGNNAQTVGSNILIGTASGFIASLAGDTANLNSTSASGQVQLKHVPSNHQINVDNIRIDLLGDVRVNNDIQLSSDVLDTNGNTGTNGQALVSQGVGNGVEWTDPDAAKAFVTLPAGANASWTVKNNYNASWNIGAGSVTLSITASSGDSGTLVVTTTTGSITWPANSNWPDATEPTLTANGTDIFSFLYDGTNYYWTFGQNFGA